jgi:spore germination cell wall hydrolase CwlJ-like protein
MSASRKRPKDAFRRPFGLVMSCVLVMPTSVGHQDLASLIARQPGVVERGRQHIRSVTTLTALNTATFSFPRPLGSTIPDAPGYQLASLDPRALDVTGSVRRSDPFHDPFAEYGRPPAPTYEFPTVDRRLKGDLLVRREPQPVAPAAPLPKPQPRKKEDRFAPKISMPETVPAISAHEPFAIPQKLIAEAERMQVRRLASEKAAEKAARDAMLAMVQPPEAEPFAIPEREIAAAQRTEANRLAASEPKLPAPAKTETPVIYPPVVAWAQADAEPFAVSEELIAESESIAMARNDESAAKPEEIAIATPQEEEATEAGAGIPVVENNRILTDEEPRDDDTAAAPAEPDNPTMQMAKLYFGADSFGEKRSLEAYGPGEAPTLSPGKAADPDIKLSVQTPPATKAQDPARNIHAALPPAKEDPRSDETNQTIAAKGEVTGEGQRPRTPAERLNLAGASRAKHERCLANAIYFEARGEYERGQMAVAQVVMNRVFSPYYPETVCGVVYQNQHKHNACQFTFACDNVRDVVTEPEAWETAKRIARDTLDGKIWLPEIGKATHYHATYVSPWWKRTMTKYKTLGIHIFYRPTRWGDGSDEPTWDPTEVQATGSIKAPDKSHADAFNKPRG